MVEHLIPYPPPLVWLLDFVHEYSGKKFPLLSLEDCRTKLFWMPKLKRICEARGGVLGNKRYFSIVKSRTQR